MTVLKSVLKTLLVILCLFLFLACAYCLWAKIKVSESVSGLRRLDDDGHLYYAEYTGDYSSPLVQAPFFLLSKPGCSAFLTQDTATGEVLTCRNYDVYPRSSYGRMSGLYVIVRLTPEGKYSSLNTADMGWFSYFGLPYYAGVLDDGKTTQLPLAFLPYMCMDGINEMGLSVSILVVDRKNGDPPTAQRGQGLENTNIVFLLRECLDNCRNVAEAADLARSFNMKSVLQSEFHLFITDSSGASAVLEWRNNMLSVTDTDAVTNFYVGWDDGEDYSRNGISDPCIRLSGLSRSYLYGYGHGYGRFNKVVTALNGHVVSTEPYRTEMSYEEALGILREVSQPYIPEQRRSFTQYSILYNNTKRSMDFYPDMDYSKPYSFSLDEGS